MAQRKCLHLPQISVQHHLVKVEIAGIQFLVRSTLEIYCEKWFDSGDVSKIEQQQLPVNWMDMGCENEVNLSRFIYSV